MSQSLSSTRSEYESKNLLRDAGIPTCREREVSTPVEVVEAAEALGYPVAIKLCGQKISHKTERDLVRLNLANADLALAAAEELWARRRDEDGEVRILIAEMVSGRRESSAVVSKGFTPGMMATFW